MERETFTLPKSKAAWQVKRFVFQRIPDSVKKPLKQLIYGVPDLPGQVTRQIAGDTVRFQIEGESEFYTMSRADMEGEFVRYVRETLREQSNPIFWDVGAAQGLYTLTIGKIADAVVALEPFPKNARVLAANLRLNGLVEKTTLLQVAAGDESGQALFYYCNDHLREGSLEKTRSFHEQLIEVQVKRVDQLVMSGLPAPTAIKIDVEGAEDLVIKGMSGLFASNFAPQDLFVEIHPKQLPRFGSSAEMVGQRIIDNGYGLESISPRLHEFHSHFKKLF